MPEREEALAIYTDAMSRERQLWEQVKGRQPGSPDFDKAVWDQWLEAVNRTNAASRALREAYSGAGRLGDP